jgi:tetratricopeptide (TPR) repeat protein
MKGHVGLMVSLSLAVLAVAWTRPHVARAVQEVKAHSDVYALPPPSVLSRASLGYRSALADYLWAHVLVTQGLRMGEKRPFSEVALYLEAINHLDPQFREPYRLADSIMSFQVGDPDREESVRQARIVLERGLVHFPYDAELWLNYGQFLAYIAPGSLPADAEERAGWQEAGAKALVRAGELAGDESTVYKAMSAAAILNRQGEVDAAIQFLERLYAVADDEDVREDVGQRLQALRQGKQQSRDFELSQAFDSVWRRDLPFARRTLLSVLGPPTDPWRCVGPAHERGGPCSVDWKSWSESVPRGTGAAP